MQKPASAFRAGGLFRILLFWAANSSHADPPARSSRDDGAADDGERESASKKT